MNNFNEPRRFPFSNAHTFPSRGDRSAEPARGSTVWPASNADPHDSHHYPQRKAMAHPTFYEQHDRYLGPDFSQQPIEEDEEIPDIDDMDQMMEELTSDQGWSSANGNEEHFRESKNGVERDEYDSFGGRGNAQDLFDDQVNSFDEQDMYLPGNDGTNVEYVPGYYEHDEDGFEDQLSFVNDSSSRSPMSPNDHLYSYPQQPRPSVRRGSHSIRPSRGGSSRRRGFQSRPGTPRRARELNHHSPPSGARGSLNQTARRRDRFSYGPRVPEEEPINFVQGNPGQNPRFHPFRVPEEEGFIAAPTSNARFRDFVGGVQANSIRGPVTGSNGFYWGNNN